MADDLFTNRSSRSDFMRRAFQLQRSRPTRVFVAVAFFTEANELLELADRDCQVKVIVRLGYPTSPKALRELRKHPGIQTRYINNDTFHPKLYIFSGWGAVVGSSNLTSSALGTNQEVNVVVAPDDPRYDELLGLFGEYWSQVRPLEMVDIDEYESLLDKHRSAIKEMSALDTELKALRPTSIKNIRRGESTRNERELFLDEYRATYQGFTAAFRAVERSYQEVGQRKSSKVPLRIEIDSFLSWIRDHHAKGESYLEAPLRVGSELSTRTKGLILEWLQAEYEWFSQEVVLKRYPKITSAFDSKERIEGASYDAIIEALSCENSFYDRLRFFKGGHETHVESFRSANDLERVKQTLVYLLFGDGDYVDRMGRCIFDPEYKLVDFGRSAVQELLGWVNDEDIPICNARTLRSLRWLGYDVELVGG